MALFRECLQPHFGLSARDDASAASTLSSALAGTSAAGLDLQNLQAGTMDWLKSLMGQSNCKNRLIAFGGQISIPVGDSLARFEIVDLHPRGSAAIVKAGTLFEVV